MLDFDDVREQICDELMEGEIVAGFCIQDILDGEFELAHRLAAIWSLPRVEQQGALDNLHDDCRKAVARYVNDKMDDETRSRLESAREDHDEYEPTI